MSQGTRVSPGVGNGARVGYMACNGDRFNWQPVIRAKRGTRNLLIPKSS